VGCLLLVFLDQHRHYFTNSNTVRLKPISSGSDNQPFSIYFLCWQNRGAVCFWQPIPSGLNLVVAVLHDSLCVSFHCCPVWQTVTYMSYTGYKVEKFVLTTVKQRLLLLLYRKQNKYLTQQSHMESMWLI